MHINSTASEGEAATQDEGRKCVINANKVIPASCDVAWTQSMKSGRNALGPRHRVLMTGSLMRGLAPPCGQRGHREAKARCEYVSTAF